MAAERDRLKHDNEMTSTELDRVRTRIRAGDHPRDVLIDSAEMPGGRR